MTEEESLAERRHFLLERIGAAADEIATIDKRLKSTIGDNDR